MAVNTVSQIPVSFTEVKPVVPAEPIVSGIELLEVSGTTTLPAVLNPALVDSEEVEFNQTHVMHTLLTDGSKKLKPSTSTLWGTVIYLLNYNNDSRHVSILSAKQTYLAIKEVTTEKQKAMANPKPGGLPVASSNSMAAPQNYSPQCATTGACIVFCAFWLHIILSDSKETREQRINKMKNNAGNGAAKLQRVAMDYGASDLRDDSAFNESQALVLKPVSETGEKPESLQVNSSAVASIQQITHAEKIHKQIVSTRKEEKSHKIEQILQLIGLKIITERFMSDTANHTNPKIFIESLVNNIPVGGGAIYNFNLAQLRPHATAFFRPDENTVILFDPNIKEFSPWPISEVGIRLANFFTKYYPDWQVERQFFRLVTLSDAKGDILTIHSRKLAMQHNERSTQELLTYIEQREHYNNGKNEAGEETAEDKNRLNEIAQSIEKKQNDKGIAWIKQGGRWREESAITNPASTMQTTENDNIAWVLNSKGEWAKVGGTTAETHWFSKLLTAISHIFGKH